MRRFLLSVATAATALTASACGDVTGINGGGVAGIYELRTIGGESLPVTLDEEFETRTYVAGEIEINNDGTFVDLVQYRNPGSSRIWSIEIFGTWERDGDRIRFEPENGNEYYLERTSSTRLVFEDFEGLRWVYQR